MDKKTYMEKEPIKKLLLKFALPSVISLIVNSLYNIVDQIFIGNYVGYLGNAATTIAFPLITISMSLALTIGNGAASYYSLKLGAKKLNVARQIIYLSVIISAIFSILYYLIVSKNLVKLLYIFGATSQSIDMTLDYTRIIIIGIPFTMFSTAISALIRADGSPKYAMYTMLSGAIINILLDKIFIIDFNLGIKGAAVATVISQLIVFLTSIYYLFNFKMVDFKLFDFKKYFKKGNLNIMYMMIYLGLSSFMAQIGFTLIQVVLNNSIKKYGALSIYGSEIPIAAFGISLKVIGILASVIIGIGIGAAPILGYNYGAKNYNRVINTYLYSIKLSTIISIIASLIFIFFPGYIVAIFGKDKSNLYIEFATKCFRIYLSGVFVVGFQINSAMFFQAIGQPLKSIILNMSRQILILIPLLILLPIKFGINGIFYCGPLADISSAMITAYFINKQIKKLKQERND